MARKPVKQDPVAVVLERFAAAKIPWADYNAGFERPPYAAHDRRAGAMKAWAAWEAKVAARSADPRTVAHWVAVSAEHDALQALEGLTDPKDRLAALLQCPNPTVRQAALLATAEVAA